MAATSVTPQKFRVRPTVDLGSPLNRWLSASCEAIQVTEDNAQELIEWCGGETAVQPGKLLALKGWTCTWQTAGVGDWVVLPEGRHFRIIYERDFANNYEPIE